MLTKKQFAKAIMREFAIDELGQDIREVDIMDISQYEIFKSSSLAVAMEYLELLRDEGLKKYASERGGHMFSSYDYNADTLDYLSVRDVMELLPE